MSRTDSSIPSTRARIANFLLLCGMLAAVTLTVVITQRLSDDALSLVLGIAIGVAALLIPSLAIGGLLYLATRFVEARPGGRARAAPAPQPQVVLLSSGGALSPGGAQQQQAFPWAVTPRLQDSGALEGFRFQAAAPRRTFTVIGEE